MSKSRFASLTAGLLARKGEAEPTASPFADELLTRVGSPAVELTLNPMPKGHHASPFGRKVAEPVVPPDYPSLFTDPVDHVSPPPLAAVVPLPRMRLVNTPPAEELAPSAACGNCPSPSEAGKVYHVNLRLKRQRFVRLKLAAALTRRAAQDIISEALDAWFAQMPDDIKGGCACMAGQEP
ncbi:MAG TPA: hypothetical protein DCL54_10855 [Alphaproteobacteria bacterium]|nr:hypothetical protein [Alphaproteobacteria bacterium]HAJ47068.1 hypothetical protein [Alphaproteobacteria bacterium]